MAAAATLILAFALFAARINRTHAPAESAFNITPAANPNLGEMKIGGVSTAPASEAIEPLTAGRDAKRSGRRVNALASLPRLRRRTERSPSPVKTEVETTEVALNEAEPTEVTTGFVPLTYLNSATAMESGIVVRVEVAREKLVALGLPLNLDRAGETIKADIVVGDDGVARAIRLVQ
jgi:hypothetical protein